MDESVFFKLPAGALIEGLSVVNGRDIRRVDHVPWAGGTQVIYYCEDDRCGQGTDPDKLIALCTFPDTQVDLSEHPLATERTVLRGHDAELAMRVRELGRRSVPPGLRRHSPKWVRFSHLRPPGP